NKLIKQAKAEGGESVLLTFYPHPRMILFPDDNNLKLLTTQPEKIKLLEKLGIEHLIIIPFTVEFSRMKAFEFVRDILVNKIGVHKLIIGYDHQFGRNREGSLKQLEEYAPMFEFEIEEIPAQDIDTIKISSTKIRNALMEGDIKTADEYLGYEYPISGEVIRGNQIGRALGFPTANIQYNNHYKLIPANGVYAVEIRVKETTYRGMMNIGRRPTLNDGDAGMTLEVNIFDFDEIIYGKVITVLLRRHIRDEIKFKNLEALSAQLVKDKTQIERYFRETKDTWKSPFI
ncbi:MAG TPA: bifunctional riboflavin kinase/FAD synthetase, partial [Firmicutes bacterium]|nr:bifunctional riboflavin kinase/FAD synthetase [Bacillota bacterium]